MLSHDTTWNYLPGRLPKKNTPVLVVKGEGRRSFVREAVYKGGGYWSGFGNAPVRAWRPLPHTPITIALSDVLAERDRILDILPRHQTSEHRHRLRQLDVEIERAQNARESGYEQFIRRACEALSRN